jgi:hypothetical protein
VSLVRAPTGRGRNARGRGQHRRRRGAPRRGTGLTASATNTARGQLPALELRHRRHTRAEDRIQVAKDTGLSNLHDFTQNQIWRALIALALDLTAWTQLLALAGHDARRWEFSVCASGCCPSPVGSPSPAAKLPCTCRGRGHWNQLLLDGITRLRAPPTAGPPVRR